MRLVSSSEWLHRAFDLTPAWQARLLLLDQDVQSVQLSFAAYEASLLRQGLAPGPGVDALTHAETFHHAKSFVCAIRRVARLASSIVSARSSLTTAQSDGIQLAWRKKASFFDAYTAPRNAIEHIDEAIPASDRIVLMNITAEALSVTDTPADSAPLTAHAVEKAVALRNELVTALCGLPPIGR